MPGVKIKCNNIRRNTKGESSFQLIIDTEVRRDGDQTRLDTSVVHSDNNANFFLI